MGKFVLLIPAYRYSLAIHYTRIMLVSYKLSVFAPMLLLAAFGLGAAASPATPAAQGITTLSDADIAAFLPYTHFAAVGYCPPSATLAWSCGANCEANPSFVPIAAGGNGDATQFCECIPAGLVLCKL